MTTKTKVKITAATREVILAALIIMRGHIQQVKDMKINNCPPELCDDQVQRRPGVKFTGRVRRQV